MLVELARAAGKPAIAEQYMKRLLRLALLRQWRETAVATAGAVMLPMSGDATPPAPATLRYEDRAYLLDTRMLHHPSAAGMQRVATAQTGNRTGTEKAGPGLPFDDKIYTLGYQVFLENSNLEDAWLVAKSAVQQAPNDLAWRERLAQVAEWTQRSDVALQNWLVIARATQQDRAWQSVLRLAPGLFDDAALIEGLRYELRRNPDNAPLAKELILAYERVGTPLPAIEFLQQQPRLPANLELLADIATRAGQMDVALQAWEQLLADPAQATPERAMRAATLAVVRGKPELAMAWLEVARHAVVPGAEITTDFLRMTGQLAERQQRDAVALDAYRQLLTTPDAELPDFDSAIRLLQGEYPLQAADVAVQTWDRFFQPRHLILALTTYVSRSQWTQVKHLLDKVSPTTGTAHEAIAPPVERRAVFAHCGSVPPEHGQPHPRSPAV